MLTCLRLVAIAMLLLASQYLPAQTPGGDLEELERPSDDTFKMEFAEHPCASLTVLVSSSQEPHNLSGLEKDSGFVSYNLTADGSFLARGFLPVRKNYSPPKQVAELIRFHGKYNGNCVLNLQLLNRNADFNCFMKAMQSLEGVEREFERFRIDATFAGQKVIGLEKEVKQEKETGTGPVIDN